MGASAGLRSGVPDVSADRCGAIPGFGCGGRGWFVEAGRAGSGGVWLDCGRGWRGGVIVLKRFCGTGAAIARVEGAAGEVRAAYTALGRALCVVITQSQAVGGEARLPDC